LDEADELCYAVYLMGGITLKCLNLNAYPVGEQQSLWAANHIMRLHKIEMLKPRDKPAICVHPWVEMERLNAQNVANFSLSELVSLLLSYELTVCSIYKYVKTNSY